MTTPQGPQGEQAPAGAPDPEQSTQVFASPGRSPQDPSAPPPYPPARDASRDGFGGRPTQGPPTGVPRQGPPTQGGGYQSPTQNPAPGGFYGPPPQVGSHQGPPSQGLPGQVSPQAPPSQGLPAQGPPAQGRPVQHPPSQGSEQWTSGPSSQGQFGAPSHVGAPRPQSANAIWALSLVSLVAVVCGLTIDEDGQNAWHTVHAWGGLAILGALLTLAPVAAGGTLQPGRAWQVAACGAGALVLFWVLFVLPAVGSNTSLATTIGVAAGAVAVWIAPGRDAAAVRADADQSQEHTW